MNLLTKVERKYYIKVLTIFQCNFKEKIEHTSLMYIYKGDALTRYLDFLTQAKLSLDS